jgi:hypothetical protein
MVNRRDALKSLAALVAGAAPGTYGYLSPDICRDRGLDSAKARVFLDGVDVTRLCVQAADDRRGYIEVFSTNAQGGKFLDHTGLSLARERRYGRVRVTF